MDVQVETRPPRPRLSRRRLILGAGALGGAAAGLVAIDLGAAALCFSPEYVWRVYAWRGYRTDDGTRFPARAISASPQPVALEPDPAGSSRPRAAFATASGASDLASFAERTRTTSLIALRNGRIALEGYFGGARRETPQASWSMAKSVTSSLVGVAMAAGVLPGVATEVATVLPDARHLRGSGVRIEHLLRMSSGFAFPGNPIPGPLGNPWNVWKRMYFAIHLRRVALAVRPEWPPGTRFLYDDRNAMLLGIMLERATHMHVSQYLAQTIWHPMGAQYPASWNMDSQASGFEKMESGINAAPLDYAKFGLLALRGGVNERGERVLPASWLNAAFTPGPRLAGWDHGPDQAYGYMWWMFPRANGPADVFADGVFGQVLYVSRATGLVILRTGTTEVGVDWPRLLHRWGQAMT